MGDAWCEDTALGASEALGAEAKRESQMVWTVVSKNWETRRLGRDGRGAPRAAPRGRGRLGRQRWACVM